MEKIKTMSKAEERALEVYPKISRITEHHGVIPADYESHYIGDANEEKRMGFIEGYHQAEKDLGLTWEDIREIYCATLNLREHLGASVFGEPLYQEVLKHFKERKETKY